MAIETCCLIGRGKVYMRRLASPQNNPLVFVGNVETLNLKIKESEVSVADFTSAGSGKDCSYSRIDSVDLTILMRCFKPENIAKAIYGNVVPASASAVSNEAISVLATDSFIPFAKLSDMSGAVVVTNTAGTTTYVDGTDYSLGNNGVYILPGGAITSGSTLHVDYPAVAQKTVEFLTNGGYEYELVLDGVNGENSKPFYVQLYRVKLATATQLDLISADFGSIEIPGQVLKSTTIAGDSNTSAYGRMRI